ncbi:MAG TPA: GNAT family N-acetyltransferase [Acidobacteriaceae bacterium]|jgi:GNAT superfamily N-acetyltransferase
MATGSSSLQPTIRRARSDDSSKLIALVERYYSEWDVWERDSAADVQYYLEQPAPLGYTVAEREDALVGCVLLRALPSSPLAAECKRLFVTAEHRGHGLASRLMDHAEAAAAAHGLQWIYLDTGEQFSAALKLYRGRGLRAV